ncbi:MAG: hypothetical protein K9N47_20755 [Prosthecobacter sp.]|uniref:hypothetical protein n=1 Tax=Prosthecobacter sp. TaxID=1965333 RepID=UPI00260ED201|nr:hypothetical protein [Prosthecobacter sp.]MCF7788565.1 hypothetical protein [Prosthecobacter sp.]
MNRSTPDPEVIPGYWRGSIYGIKGERWDYQFEFKDDHSYTRMIRSEDKAWKSETGHWSYDGNIHLSPNGDPIAPTFYSLFLIPSFEESGMMLVIRPVIFATPNYPMILYKDFIRAAEAREERKKAGNHP